MRVRVKMEEKEGGTEREEQKGRLEHPPNAVIANVEIATRFHFRTAAVTLQGFKLAASPLLYSTQSKSHS